LRTQSTKEWTPAPCHRLEGRRWGGTGARNQGAAAASPATRGTRRFWLGSLFVVVSRKCTIAVDCEGERQM
jgi:hypothetical protein